MNVPHLLTLCCWLSGALVLWWQYQRDLAYALRVIEAGTRLGAFVHHDCDCIRTFWEAGEPTPGGGYREKFQGVWYASRPVDQTPPCGCGASDALAHYRQVTEGR